MQNIFYQLGRPFAFGQIDHQELRPFLTWIPLLVAGIVAAAYVALPTKPNLVGDGSLSRHFIAVFATLPGFFIAALAAIATFARDGMDSTMPAPAPRLKLRVGDEEDWVDLTFRMFLTHLFAYLTAISFLSVFLFVAVDLVSASGTSLMYAWLGVHNYAYVAPVSNAAYVLLAIWLASKIVLTTLFGLYFLAERIHRPAA